VTRGPAEAGNHIVRRCGSNLELVRVSDSSAGKIWLISSDTLAKLPELYDQVQRRGKVESTIAANGMVKYQPAGMPLWRGCSGAADSSGGGAG